MCDDVEATIAQLEAKGVELARLVSDEGWGLVTAIALPGGGELGLPAAASAAAARLGASARRSADEPQRLLARDDLVARMELPPRRVSASPLTSTGCAVR